MRPTILIALILLMSALAFSQESDIVKAKYNVAECYINATVQLLNAVPMCAEKYYVNASDLTSYNVLMESDRSDLKSATTLYDFDVTWAKTQEDMNKSGAAIAEVNNTLEGSNLSIGLARLCYAGQMLGIYLNGTGCVIRETFGGFSEVAILAYYDATIQNGGILLNNSKSGGLETSGMEAALDYGISLRPELVSALDARDSARFKNVRLRFGRAEIRYFAEYATALSDWAYPRVQYSNNYNKDEILDRITGIRGEIDQINSQCPAQYTISDEASYEQDNLQCWDMLKTVESDSKAVIALYRSGVPVYVGGTGSLHAQGNGEVSAFGSANITITGNGDLFVTDYNRDAVVTVDVPGVSQPDGSKEYKGFTDARISGSLIHVLARGNITFDATGKGIVKMHGTGSFYTTPGMGGEGNYTEVD